MKLTFGKYRLYRLEDVPGDYLFWLTCWKITGRGNAVSIWAHCDGENFKDKISQYLADCEGAIEFLLTKQLNVVWKAREVFKNKRLCIHCFRALVAVGFARQNGKMHSDWSTRKLHKKCWKEIRGM